MGPKGFVLANAICAADQAKPFGLIKTLPNLFRSSIAALPNPKAPPLTKLSVTWPINSNAPLVS